MLWKILSGLAAIALGVGVWFSLQTQQALKIEKELATRAKSDLTSTQEAFKKGGEVKERREKELAEVEKQRDEVKAEVAKVQTDADQKLAEIEIVKKTLEEVNKQLLALEDQIAKAGDIKKLLAKVEELTTQKKAAEAAIANHQQQLALAEEKLTKLSAEITRLEEVDKRQRAGVVEPGFTARVSQPYTNFGFVILNKGNLGGMFANAMLDVKRGENVVAKLKVRDVEQSMSVADLVPGSLADGDAIRSGDLVVAAKVAPAPAPTEAAPPPTTPAPGGAAPAPAPPGSDPFGAAPGMAAPTPAPAAADPFGAAPAGGMAPAPAPAAPAGADPFAPAPPAGGAAPAAPAAPPAPGGAAPAPAAPDPFAPPPAGGAPATPPTPPPPPAQ